MINKLLCKCLFLYLYEVLIKQGNILCMGVSLPHEGKTIILESSTVGEVHLGCPYKLDYGDERGLVVSWFYNDLPYPIYQWIPLNPPQAVGFLKNYVDLSYEASKDNYYRHSTLRILDPPTNITGKYTCKVSSFADEKVYTIYLIVFTFPSVFDLAIERRNEDGVVIKCEVGQIFPEPKVLLYKDRQQKRIPISNGHVRTTWAAGVYNVSVEAGVKDSQLDGKTQFECHLKIPETNISLGKTVKYIPNVISSELLSSSSENCGSESLIQSIFFLVYIVLYFSPLTIKSIDY